MGEGTFNFSVIFTVYFVHSQLPQNWCLSPEQKLLYLHIIGYKTLLLEKRQLNMSGHVSTCSILVPKLSRLASQPTSFWASATPTSSAEDYLLRRSTLWLQRSPQDLHCSRVLRVPRVTCDKFLANVHALYSCECTFCVGMRKSTFQIVMTAPISLVLLDCERLCTHVLHNLTGLRLSRFRQWPCGWIIIKQFHKLILFLATCGLLFLQFIAELYCCAVFSDYTNSSWQLWRTTTNL